MANFNKVILAGNLTRDPQLSVLPSNTPVCEFGMAINRKWRGQEGDMREETCFVDLRAFGRTADTINKYMSKGKPIMIEGRLKYDQWEAKDGGKRSKLYVVVDNFQFIDSGGGGGGGGRGGSASRSDRNADYDEMPPVASGAENADDIPF
ncbi:MAG TPA: single-stranded DNA-binding protein [Phycisphaerae bacterium]|nr:single-stranded DNA-binding protein [Phycisphaerae bacterium]HRW51261.1 single-stranded DNA-binding protein [Phycisphaerae bacterium]